MSPPLLPVLRSDDWPGREHAWSRPLARLPGVGGLPLLALAEDRGSMLAFVGERRLALLDIDAQEAERRALEHLCQRDATWRWVQSMTPVGDWLATYVCEGSLAAERILDVQTMVEAQQLVASGKPLAVGIPHQDMLLCTALGGAASGAFPKLVRSLWERPTVQGAEQLTPLVFLVDRGHIVGHAG